ncbi:pilus assembly protein [Methylobacterium sp. BTF04]|uniref:TadE/TadG family type IV pilus assembly protein n=1 Tax=Methylobacterium sp. BTF04 TaxID=2708300 RepID=UPI0013D2DF82|nr:TadE/TadG family type IV pilus assembly protein [Methylobacterium sp. BTF04]NEU15000.1 pilus assembly protein [Methylobacterium sp. BTF04]
MPNFWSTLQHAHNLNLLRTLLRPFRQWKICDHGTSIVEFALIAPVLVVLMLSMIDYGRAFIASYRTGFIADTIAELVSQTKQTLTESDLTDFIKAAPLIDSDILRYGQQIGNKDLTSLVYVNISSIAMSKLNINCTASCVYLGSVVFSRALAGPVRQCGLQAPAPNSAVTTPQTLPVSVFGPVDIIVVDVTAFFKPLFLSPAMIPTEFRKSAYFRPRNLVRVTSTSNCAGF